MMAFRFDSTDVPRHQVQRLDYGTIGQIRETPQGGIRVPASLTRVGIFEYTRPDGTTQRELRRPSEVFHPDSLTSLLSAPVTDLHPREMVTSSNWGSHARGHVAEGSVKQDGQFVAAELVIQHDSLVRKVKRKDRKEISCGYGCVVLESPGVVQGIAGLEHLEGQRYDCEQTFIRYNHVATGPEGWGRAGPDVKMRLDSQGNQEKPKDTRPMNKLLPLLALAFANDYRSCRIDGVEFRLDSEDGRKNALAALGQGHQRLREIATRTDLDPEKAKMMVDEVMATFAALQTQLMALAVACTDVSMVEPAAPAMEDVPEETLDAWFEERSKFRDRAKKLHPEVKFDKKSTRDVMVECLAARKVEIRKDASDDFVRGMFEALPIAEIKTTTHRTDATLTQVQAATSTAAPAAKPRTAEQVRADSRQKSRNAWRNPLDASRQDGTIKIN